MDSSSATELVLVTGVSGFVGSHVAARLLADGYRVRGTVRGSKVASIQAASVAKNRNFEVVTVEDIATNDLSNVLKGVKYVVHTASPLAGRASAADGLKSSVDGNLNIIQQGFKAGVTKFVLTSTWGTIMDPSLHKMYTGAILTNKDWGNVSEADILDGGHTPFWNYLGSKILAESAAWKYAEEHPEIDLTTINPPFIYGPPHPDFPPVQRTRLGTNGMVYALIAGEPGRALPPLLSPFFCDVRDVALAHSRSLKVGLVDNGNVRVQKRFLVCGGWFTWKEAAEYVTVAHEHLKNRLPALDTAKPLPGPISITDVSPASTILGLKEYIPWKQCVLDTLDALLVAEKTWKETH
ncbi:NAD(P)-binding protein [Favolaschia claudopus]|uniref:NAD(P)-binding protein n=1 Tax=Favolaschia claudopus TaxID=2862362 RepID=A0AAW0AYG7_9AGAR